MTRGPGDREPGAVEAGRHRSVEVNALFAEALECHRLGIKLKPAHVAAILAELDRALMLMALHPASLGQPARDFLAIHAEAPYIRG